MLNWLERVFKGVVKRATRRQIFRFLDKMQSGNFELFRAELENPRVASEVKRSVESFLQTPELTHWLSEKTLEDIRQESNLDLRARAAFAFQAVTAAVVHKDPELIDSCLSRGTIPDHRELLSDSDYLAIMQKSFLASDLLPKSGTVKRGGEGDPNYRRGGGEAAEIECGLTGVETELLQGHWITKEDALVMSTYPVFGPEAKRFARTFIKLGLGDMHVSGKITKDNAEEIFRVLRKSLEANKERQEIEWL